MNAPVKLDKATDLKLPSHWTALVCRAIVIVADMAHKSMIRTRSWSANSPIERVRLRARLERAGNELSKLREVNRLLTERMKRVSPHKRPQYKPHERLAILEYRAANGLSLADTAKLFLITPDTIGYWQREVNAGNNSSLFSLSQPVNKYPEYITYVVQRLKSLCPHLGKKKMAEFLARAALHVSATTVERKLKEPPTRLPDIDDDDNGPDTDNPGPPRVVTAKKSGQAWHIDLTTVPIDGTCNVGATPDEDKALQGGWPYNWHVAIVEDHFSRACIGFGIFAKEPESKDITDMLDNAIRERGKAPKYIISDKGSQFYCDHYKDWAKDHKKKNERDRRRIRPRFGALYKHGSIAILERINLTLKTECIPNIIVPYNRDDFAEELDLFFTWYNEYRPHSALGGRTPMEVYTQVKQPANQMPRIEPREKFPEKSRCAGVQAPIDGKPGQKAELQVALLEGRRHLPIIHLTKIG